MFWGEEGNYLHHHSGVRFLGNFAASADAAFMEIYNHGAKSYQASHARPSHASTQSHLQNFSAVAMQVRMCAIFLA